MESCGEESEEERNFPFRRGKFGFSLLRVPGSSRGSDLTLLSQRNKRNLDFEGLFQKRTVEGQEALDCFVRSEAARLQLRRR